MAGIRDVVTAEALERVDRAREGVADRSVTVTLSNGEPNIRSPLTVTTDVAGSVFADGHVSECDLADAGHYPAAGTLSPTEFERAYHAWLDGRAIETTREGVGDDD
jgi:hypothetical protein